MGSSVGRLFFRRVRDLYPESGYLVIVTFDKPRGLSGL